MTFPVPTLAFGTIRRHIWLLNIFAFAKIDARFLDVGAPLSATHRAARIEIDAAERVIRSIEAVDVAIRADEAVEIGRIAVHEGRVHIAANIREDLLDMSLFF